MSLWYLVSIWLFFHNVCGQTVSVITKLGEIRGTRVENGYTQFMGVPYAVVDEDNPLAPSTPHPGFPTPFEAIDESVSCYGIKLDGRIQCLTLNIFVPDSAATNTLPVMVWIHGGAFVDGNGNTFMNSPNFLLEHDVIVVNINYRLGIYGFMCTDSELAPGNTGLKDQLLAFRWINENISEFGGDTNRITAFGESAGGMSINLHMTSKYERLFQRAIIQSGPAVSSWAMVPLNNTVPLVLSEALGLSTDNLDDAIMFIARANPTDVVTKGLELGILPIKTPMTKPCVENPNLNIDRFIELHPSVAEVKTDIDVLIGYNSEELIFQFANEPDSFYENYPFDFLLRDGFDMTDFDDVDTIRQFYTGDKELNRDLELEITNYGSDYAFNHPTERVVETFLRDESRTIYKYMFSYEGGRNFIKNILVSNPNPIHGAAHADELGYLFDMGHFTETPNAEDQRIIDIITTTWTNFAKYGDPIPEVNDLIPVKWVPINSTMQPFLNIDRDLTIEYRTYHDRMAFWDLLYFGNQDKNLALRPV